MIGIQTSKQRRPKRASKIELTPTQRLAGFDRSYKLESTPQTIADEQRKAGQIRRRIEDIRLGLELKDDFSEVWY